MGGGNIEIVDTSLRLVSLRDLMKKEDVQALVVPSEDQHFSEYVASCDKRRAFISGFDGSAGLAIITLDKAFLFTDGRYFLQAEKQLDRNWTLMKSGLPDVPTWKEFLENDLPQGTRIGLDPTLISADDADSLKKSLFPKESKLVLLDKNLVDIVWGDARPPRPQSKVFPLDTKYSGEPFQEKIQRLREEIKAKDAKAIVVNMLDEVAWLFNLRGGDVDYNPVFFAYTVVTLDSATLFVDPVQVDEVVKSHLGPDVQTRPYDSFFKTLQDIRHELNLNSDQILIGTNASLAIAEAVGEGYFKTVPSAVNDMKAIKNSTEIEGFRQSHIRDGVALARYFAWLEEQLNQGVTLNESQGADQLDKFRWELDLYRGISFETISSAGPNAAVIHYAPDPKDCAIIKKDQIYLCDSGGQYLDGTTDVTRTWHFGCPTDEEKRAFTRVLQGHIAIDTFVFPSGTTGYQIDILARRPLWQDGLDYRHGTGHGVGHFLNIHEGPHGIANKIALNSFPLKAGMTVSNEPGYYADGRFGVRIESVVIVKDVNLPNNFGDKGYLGFENITMCPIQKSLVDLSLIAPQEREWLNAYHAETFEKISPFLKNDERALKWLERECSPI